MNEVDLKKIADSGRRTCDLVEDRGLTALRRAHSWKNSSGVYVPPDPDAEGPGRDKLDRLDPIRHERLVAAHKAFDQAAATLRWLLLDTVPRTPDKPRDSDVPDGACENCWTNRRHFEPVAHYRACCRWCGDFKATEGRYPPLALLRKRHAGQRVTTADVERALGRTA